MESIYPIVYGLAFGIVGVSAGIIIHRILYTMFNWILNTLDIEDEEPR